MDPGGGFSEALELEEAIGELALAEQGLHEATSVAEVWPLASPGRGVGRF